MPGHVHSRGLFDAFQAGRGIHFQHQRPAPGTDQVHARHAQSQHPRGTHRHLALGFGYLHCARTAAAMQVGAEIALGRLPPHRRNHPAAHHETAQIRAFGLGDEFLHQEIGVQPAQRFNDAARSRQLLGQHHARALGALVELDDVRCGPEHRQQIVGVVGVFAEHRARQTDALRGQQLMRAQLVARDQDRIGRIGREAAHQFELAQHGRAVARDRGADARNHRCVAGDFLALVVHGKPLAADGHVAAQRVEHAHAVAALAHGFDQAPGGIQFGVAGQNGQFHAEAAAGGERWMRP